MRESIKDKYLIRMKMFSRDLYFKIRSNEKEKKRHNHGNTSKEYGMINMKISVLQK